MGRYFLEQMSGYRLYDCRQCRTNISSVLEILSMNFMGATGPAFLFNRVVNVNHGRMERRNFLTGLHYVRDVRCKVCNIKLGWFYEMAQHESEQYKEGKTVIELTYVIEVLGLNWESFRFFEEDTEF